MNGPVGTMPGLLLDLSFGGFEQLFVGVGFALGGD